jgi:hypothetical protein
MEIYNNVNMNNVNIQGKERKGEDWIYVAHERDK